MQRHAVAGLGEEPHDLGAGDRFDVDGGEVIEHDEVRRFARGFGDRAQDRPGAQAKLTEARAALGQGRELRAGVIAAGLRVLANIAATQERG